MNTVVQQKLYCVQQKLRKDLKNPSSYSVLFKAREKKKKKLHIYLARVMHQSSWNTS